MKSFCTYLKWHRKTNVNMKTLVAYFSATGTTEQVAKELADVTGE